MRAILVAFLDGVFVAAAWGGFALIGIAAITWLLDWGHLLSASGGDDTPQRSARWTAIVGAMLLLVGLAGVLINSRG